MKRKVGFLITLVLSTVVLSVTAQYEQNALREITERSAYGNNWFVSLGGSANLLTAEQDGAYFVWKDRVKYGGDLSIGKWFNPNYGARLQVQYGGLSGFNFFKPRGGNYLINSRTRAEYPMAFSNGRRGELKEVDANRGYWKGERGFLQEFNYGSATFDLMSNFTNLLRGHYKEGARFDFIGFAGLGIIHSFKNELTNPNFWHFAAKVGFRVNFNVTNDIAIYLEPQATLTQQEFDGYRGTGDADGFARLGLGLQYTFNKRFDDNISQVARLTADEIDRLNRKINDNRYLIDNHQNILERQQDLLDRLQKCCDEPREIINTQVIDNSALPEYVRFGLDSYKIEPGELRKITDAVDYLQKNPDSKVLIIGYADRKTGNPRYNLALSQRRVDAVANEMKRQGISANRIISEFKGDTVQPFPQNEWNRVVVIVERK